MFRVCCVSVSEKFVSGFLWLYTKPLWRFQRFSSRYRVSPHENSRVQEPCMPESFISFAKLVLTGVTNSVERRLI